MGHELLYCFIRNADLVVLTDCACYCGGSVGSLPGSAYTHL
jgi:hypothetical protein